MGKKKRVLRVGIPILVLLTILLLSLVYSRSWERGFFLEPLHRLPADTKTVALTFDDGPSDARTLPLLELLDRHNVKATFFMLGSNIEKHRAIAGAVVARGHLVGNHSYDHPKLIFKSPSFVRKQVVVTDSLIRQLGQQEVKYFRPPGSAKYLVLPWLLKKMNKVLVTGTYDPPAEYKSPYDAALVARQVTDNISPGAIIYLHDGKSTDVDAFIRSVEMIIVELKEKGYHFVRLDDE